jgi:hypothetical protein
MSAWSSNSRFELIFDDRTPNEIQTDDISRVKAVLTRKINEASIVVVFVGKHANELHPDYQEIGYRNWQNFEIAKAREFNKKIIAIQVDSSCSYPDELYKSNATIVYGFNESNVKKVIGR